MGNLATEIFFGPNLAGGFRVPTREVGGGICCKFRRVIPRRASIAPVIVGIAFSSAATLTVNTAPAITSNPTNQTVIAGNSVTFTAAASGQPTARIA